MMIFPTYISNITSLINAMHRKYQLNSRQSLYFIYRMNAFKLNQARVSTSKTDTQRSKNEGKSL